MHLGASLQMMMGVYRLSWRKTPNPPTDQINAGCYVFRREIIESIPAGVPVSVERDVFPHLLETDCRMYGHVDSHYWRDMGTPQDFMQGSADLVQGIAPSPALEGHQGDYLVLPGADVAETASLQQGTVVGQGAVVGHNDVVTSSVLFDGAVLGDDVVIERSLIGNGAHIGNGCVVRDAVIGDDAIIGDRCELLDGIRVWPGIEIPDAAIRFFHRCLASLYLSSSRYLADGWVCGPYRPRSVTFNLGFIV